MKSRENNTHALRDVATIQPGYPFRGKLPLSAEADAFVIQFRHVVVGEPLTDALGKTLDKATLTGRKQPNFLRSGDIIFMAKGNRNQAALIGEVPSNTVCTPNFYCIRLKPEIDGLLPEFLNWQLNHQGAQRYFTVCSQGSVAASITKSQLETFPVSIPPIKKQELMIRLAEAASQERKLMNELIENRQRMVVEVGHRILNPENNTEH
jgi:hypothetical protein